MDTHFSFSHLRNSQFASYGSEKRHFVPIFKKLQQCTGKRRDELLSSLKSQLYKDSNFKLTTNEMKIAAKDPELFEAIISHGVELADNLRYSEIIYINVDSFIILIAYAKIEVRAEKLAIRQMFSSLNQKMARDLKISMEILFAYVDDIRECLDSFWSSSNLTEIVVGFMCDEENILDTYAILA